MARKFTRLLMRLLIVVIVGAVGIIFAQLNSSPVELNYYSGSIEYPLAAVMLIAFLIGVLAGVLPILKTFLKSKREISKLRRTVNKTEKELYNLRALPLKDNG